MDNTAAPPPPEAEPSPSPAAASANRFFDWIRGLGIDRQPGWIGGVCAGIAARIGIDPIIVRGIVVVVAILGGPAFLFYAIAWLLLPDRSGTIHLERAIRGAFDNALIGILIIFALVFLPGTRGFWFYGPDFDSAGWAIGRTVWILIIIGSTIWVSIWLWQRSQRGAGIPSSAYAMPATATGTDAGSSAASSEGATRPEPPSSPGVDATTDQLADWKLRQAEWKVRFDEWKRQQATATREQRVQRAAEARARGAAIAAESAERQRIRQLQNPRLGGALTAISLGLALFAGGLAAFAASNGTSWQGAELAVGLATATLVIGVSMIIAGSLRRRTGFLGFVVTLLVIATVLAAFIPRDREMVGVRLNLGLDDRGRYSQLVGSMDVGGQMTSAGGSQSIDLWQAAGDVYITVPEGVTIRFVATQQTGSATLVNYSTSDDASDSDSDDGTFVMENRLAPTSVSSDGTETFSRVIGDSKHPDVTVRLWQGAGAITIDDHNAVDAPLDTNGGN
jgi:phage shock protein PspC (stress-responsive transcriptional regulator)